MKQNRKNIIKILIITILFQFLLFVNISEAASTSEDMTWEDIFKSGDEFLNKGKEQVTVGANTVYTGAATDEETKAIINNMYSILFSIGVVATVVVGGALGIKFMVASAEDKAKVKESMIPYVVGCVVIYGAFGIWKICIQILSALS